MDAQEKNNAHPRDEDLPISNPYPMGMKTKPRLSRKWPLIPSEIISMIDATPPAISKEPAMQMLRGGNIGFTTPAGGWKMRNLPHSRPGCNS